ncbi:MAG: YoaK family protein [Balneolaceae bacterium]
MFRHQGKRRTFKHNVQLASFLSFVAGVVNVAGFLSIQQLTTNVTGHFALFINDVAELEVWKGTIYFLYFFSFLFGSFAASIIIDIFKYNKKMNVYLIPTFIEAFILVGIAILYRFPAIAIPDLIACLLLFAMGLQNSFVTKISNAVVRTTHLTGLFTDLGIELSHLFFPKRYPQHELIISTIKLRIYIIGNFFLGGLIGGFIYTRMGLGMDTLIFAAAVLLISIFYDDYRIRLTLKIRRFFQAREQS